MKGIILLGLSLLIALSVISSCGDKGVKPENQNQTNAVSSSNPSGYDKMNDTAFANVMSVLKDALDQEKNASDSSTKLTTAKAYILVIKFIRTDKEKVKKAGMSDTDITYLVNDARDKATSRLNEIIASQTAPQAIKDEAKSKLQEVSSL